MRTTRIASLPVMTAALLLLQVAYADDADTTPTMEELARSVDQLSASLVRSGGDSGIAVHGLPM